MMTFNIATGERQFLEDYHVSGLRHLQVAPGGKEIWAAVSSGMSPIIEANASWLVRWKLADNTIETVTTPPNYKLWAFALHPDGKHVALKVTDKEPFEGESGPAYDHTVLMMSITDGRVTRVVGADEIIEQSIVAMALSPDGARLAAAGRYDTTFLYRVGD